MRIFRDENFFDANTERGRRRRGRLRKGEFLSVKGGINSRADDRSSKRKGWIPPVDFARVVPATSICRDSSGVYRQLPDPANFWLLGVIGPARRLPCYPREGRKPFLLSTTILDFSSPPPQSIFPEFLKLSRICQIVRETSV